MNTQFDGPTDLADQVSSTERSGVVCGACGEMADDRVGTIPFYLKSGVIQTRLWKCRSCGTYIRDTNYDTPSIREHFEVASYTDPRTEVTWRRLRVGLFRHILSIAESHIGRPYSGMRTLDIGTAFGILLEMLRDAGAQPEGVEIVAALRELARHRGLVVHATLDQLPVGSYQLITAIDSFYYMNDPRATLLRVKELMAEDGILIMRLTNRTWYFDATRALGRRISSARFDDIKFNFSIEGAQRLLERSGYRIENFYWSDKGRGDSRPLAAIYYRVSPFLSRHLSLRITPGMIIVARPLTRGV